MIEARCGDIRCTAHNVDETDETVKVQENCEFLNKSATTSEKICTNEWKPMPHSIEKGRHKGPTYRKCQRERIMTPFAWL